MPRKNKNFKQGETVFVRCSDVHNWKKPVVAIVSQSENYNHDDRAVHLRFDPIHKYNIENLTEYEMRHCLTYSLQAVPLENVERYESHQVKKYKVKSLKNKRKNIMEIDW